MLDTPAQSNPEKWRSGLCSNLLFVGQRVFIVLQRVIELGLDQSLLLAAQQVTVSR